MAAAAGNKCTSLDCEDIMVEKVIINNYKSLLPKEYKRLQAVYIRQNDTCQKCHEQIEVDTLGICAGDELTFHSLCILYEHKFMGKINEIVGFASLNNDDRDLLREIPSGGAEEEIYEDEENSEWDEDMYSDGDMEIEPPIKRNPNPDYLPLEPGSLTVPAKAKSAERLLYEEFLRTVSPADLNFSTNPERGWAQKKEIAVKVPIVKRGALIDRESPNAISCHVVKTDKGDLYSVTLCHTDIPSNRNSYFKMQLLKEDDLEIYYLFRSWGRIGTQKGGSFTETFHMEKEAIVEFERDFEELSGNKWRERHFFNTRDRMMTLVEMDYTEFETLICEDGKLLPAGLGSTLHPKITAILLKIFDAKNIHKALDVYNFDTERMPMGKLTPMQISRANGFLKQAREMIDHHGPGSSTFNAQRFEDEIIRLSNKFYSLLPQSFGHCSPIHLSRIGQCEKMEGMIDALLDIVFICNIMNDAAADAKKTGLDPIDIQYKKLLTRMEIVPHDHDDYKRIVQYIDNGVGATHGYKGFELLDLIRLERYGEEAKFRKSYGNRKLLWHGSPVQNFPGILTQGLRIAPPDAIQTGHAFGRGVYFADMISKSANYCRVLSPLLQRRRRPPTGAMNVRPVPQALQQNADEDPEADSTGFLLLCDVALGTSKDLTYGSSSGIAPHETHYKSVKGVGETYPDPEQDFLHPDGYAIPLGKVIRSNSTRSAHGGFLYYNEYIVYDTDQICARYLCRVKFDHGHNR